MRVEELHDHYGTWSALSHALKQGLNSHAYWRKIGYIPWASQLVIEHKTGGLFKACREDCEPKPKA